LGQIEKTRGNETIDLLGDTLPYVNLGANFEAVSVEAGLYFNCAMSVDKAVKVSSEQDTASSPKVSVAEGG